MSVEHRLLRAAAQAEDPIVAPSTAPGRAAISVLRLSGSAAALDPILAQTLPGSGDLDTQRLRLARLVHPSGGEVIDQALVVRFRAPRSYTGEDLVEFHLHGNPLLVERALDALVAAGARLAGPGEFTRRAVANGRMDLVEAEATHALIQAQSEAALRAARRHLGGELQERLSTWRNRLLGVAVALEAIVDFPEEVDEAELQADLAALVALSASMRNLAATAEAGRGAVAGFRVAFVGPPNAGKSTVFNALLGHERALVSEHAGTTRDVVSEQLHIDGLCFRLEDTAGERRAEDPLEAAGIARTQRARELADRVLAVRNGQEIRPDDALPEEGLPVATRGDLLDERLAAALGRAGWIVVGAPALLGLDELKAALVASAQSEGDLEGLVLHTRRQQGALFAAAQAVDRGLAAGSEEPAIAAVEVRGAGRALEELVGMWSSEAVLDTLFERFCIGK